MSSRSSMAAIVLMLWFTSYALQVSATCDSRDEAALLAFKNEDKQRKLRLSSWEAAATKTCCEWQGISCDPKTGRVTTLKLQGILLGGKLSAELANLTDLQVLDLHDTGLVGHVHSFFGKLVKLQILDLGNNFLSGPIPTSFEQLASSLRVLDLTRHNFRGPLSSVIGKLVNLEQLVLDSSDVLSPESSIPAFLGNLRNLRHLHMKASSFTGSIPDAISELTQLRTLDLTDSMKLSGSVPAFLAKLVNLESLALGSTSLSGPIPSSIGSLPKLKFLDLSSSGVGGRLPSELGSLVNLQTLEISGTQVTGSIPDSLGNLKQLKVLDLSQNTAMHGPIPDSFGKLSSLEMLDLTSCGLTGNIPSSLGQLRNLNTLTLSSNALSGGLPESLSLLENLDSLSAADNFLSGKLPESFGTKLSNLSTIQLTNNSISGLPSNMKNLGKLYAVYLDRNPLSFESISGLSTLPRLSIMLLSRCNLKGPIPGWMENMKLKPDPVAATAVIDMSFNSITGSIPSGFGNMPDLTTLFLQSNMLTGMVPASFGQGLTKLTFLDLSSNFLTGIPPNLDKLGVGVLYSFAMEHNNLTFSSLSGLATLSRVSFLTLDNCRLSGPIPAWFSNIRMVQDQADDAVVRLSSNLITGSIPSELGQFMTKVTALYLDNNLLSGPIPASISNMVNLRRLDLSRNRLTGNIPSEFLKMSNLKYLNVSSNQLHGQIPQQMPLITMDPSCYAGNAGLCGPPLPHCG